MLRTLISCAVLGLLGPASALVARDAPGTNENFGLYAYGDSIGGLSLFYAGGMKALVSIGINCGLIVQQARP